MQKNPTGISFNNNLAIGSGLAVAGNILISVSLNLQKYVHLRNAAREVEVHYTKELLWWFGLLLMGAGELFNFTAYGFAPASVVAPLGTTTVVANLFLAAIFLKEKIRSENLFGCGLAIVGAFLLVYFSNQNEKVMGSYEIIEGLSQPIFVAYVCFEMIVLAGLLCMLYHKKMEHVLIYLLISSITASFTVISAKAVSGMIQLSFVGYSQWDQPVLYAMIVVLIVTALVQIKFVNLAMKNYEATIVVPVNFVIFTISAILAGIVFYKEFYGMNGLQITMFLFGCALSFMAVYFIAVGKMTSGTGAKPDLQPQNVASDLIPSWMMANVNVGQVQPSGHVEHLKDTETDSDKVPILHSEALETIQEADGPDEADGDGISVTSMDMLLDREKMGATNRANYSSTSRSN
ncbi:NIPA-like protein 2 isoform X2 [Aplysia californica]|uniref:NIPA-like protein 2 isoform X2 n=1 Tax=Aplysia californica TaxID=6500 RepID=A0ABM1A943_APLCA|nr:NIPA-like protein 2 isoform X2 [Aplysia californica]